MLRSPRVWLYAVALWLTLAGLTQLCLHAWAYGLEQGMTSYGEFAVQAMRQARTADPLQPSLWRVFRAYSVSTGLLLVSCGITAGLIAREQVGPALVTAYGLAGTLFWTVAFLAYALIDPVILPLVTAGVAVPLHGIAYLTASAAASG